MNAPYSPPQITMQACSSTSLHSHGYHPESRTLAIRFKEKGPVYHFKDVPHELYAEFQKADSFGRFFQSRIKDKFEHVKLDPVVHP